MIMNYEFLVGKSFQNGKKKCMTSLVFRTFKHRSINCTLLPTQLSIGTMKHFLSTALSFLVLASTASQGSAEPLWKDVCTQDETKDLPFCDMTLALDERIMDYVQRVPMKVQMDMMGHNASGYEGLSIPPYMWWSEGLHGPLEPCVTYKDQCVCPSNFPTPSAMANAFNRTLYSLVGRAIGAEGKAISNLRPHDQSVGDGLTYWYVTYKTTTTDSFVL